MSDIEAVRFTEWGPWHAVREGSDQTVCGLDARKARKMWADWNEKTHRCQTCSRKLS
jgi:hypothetical protein